MAAEDGQRAHKPAAGIRSDNHKTIVAAICPNEIAQGQRLQDRSRVLRGFARRGRDDGMEMRAHADGVV
jgi:hypothetical protein